MPENIIDGVKEILYSGALTYGKWSIEFENELRNYLKTDRLLTVNSFFSAISVALSVFDIKEGDEIITSPMSCLASNQPLIVKGAKVVWADIDPKTGTLCPESVKKKISKKTKAIIHNHHAGFIGHIDEINEIGREKGIYVIDDSIEAFGGEYKGCKIGNCGTDITVLSFQAIRLPNTMEGGGVVFKDQSLFEKAIRIRDLGVDRNCFRDNNGEISPKCDITEKGYQAMMNNLNSYIGLKQMPLIDKLFSKQRNNAKRWDAYFKDNNFDCTPLSDYQIDKNPNYWVYGILCKNKLEMRDYYRGKDYFASGVHLNNDCYSVFGKQEELKGVNEFYSKFLALPSGWWFEK